MTNSEFVVPGLLPIPSKRTRPNIRHTRQECPHSRFRFAGHISLPGRLVLGRRTIRRHLLYRLTLASSIPRADCVTAVRDFLFCKVAEWRGGTGPLDDLRQPAHHCALCGCHRSLNHHSAPLNNQERPSTESTVPLVFGIGTRDRAEQRRRARV